MLKELFGKQLNLSAIHFCMKNNSFEINQNIRIFVITYKFNFMRYLIIVLLFTQFQIAFSQDESNNFKFRVYLKDKDVKEFEETDPKDYLSQKAIDRREEQCVDVNLTDYPVSTIYKRTIEELGGEIVAESKWFNTLVVQCADSIQIREFEGLNFIDSVKFVWRGQPFKDDEMMRPRLKSLDCAADTLQDSWFGVSAPQFEMHNAHHMLNAGFRGKGINIAVIDAGFTNIDVIPSFSHSFILGHKNFVPDGGIFSASDHGTKVVSTMAINMPNKVMGSAPQAFYYLLRSEDERTEYPVEEDYWVAAIEYADSIGVKLVNTSLGYNHFDDSTLNYTHNELTGKRSLISRAADLAFDKGMLIVGSAGNEGNKSWEKITVPGDSEKVLTVGAVSLDSTIANFSSRGPTADGRIKPDLVSVGKQAITIGQRGVVGTNNGTSFSSPFLTGLIGSLWSVNSQLNRNQLIDIVRRSGHQYHNPDSIFGYGIPNFEIAYRDVLKTLKQESDTATSSLIRISRTKNDYLIIALNNPKYQHHSYSLRILNEKGNTILSEHFESSDFVFELTKQIKEENAELYVVAHSPFEQRTIRFKI